MKVEGLNEGGEEIDIEKDNVKMYFISLYFVMQTITTVGYGDVSPTNTKERIFIVILMLIGVISFSFISGSLSSIIQSYDDQVSAEKTRTQRINKIAKQFQLTNEI
jgi:voltage-gated potassium channel